MRWLSALVLIAMIAPARAETLGAWTFTPPDGYKVETANGRRSYTKVDGNAFCLVGVYEPRAATSDLAADLKKEWTEVVEAQFVASQVNAYPAKETKRKLAKHTVGAKLKSGAQEFYGQLVVVRGGGAVGSVIIMAANASSITACHPAANIVMDSIVVGPMPAAPVAGSAAPAARAASASIMGAWAASVAANEPGSAMSHGSQKRQYTFKADGTYGFRMESWYGHYQKPQWYIVDESGTYKVDGGKVTVTPTSVKGIVKDDKGTLIKNWSPLVETVTYEWKFHYFEGLKDNQLVLTPPKETTRDGKLVGSGLFPKSVLYSSQYKPEWKYP